MSGPEKPPGLGNAAAPPPGKRVCPGCGWENAASAATCEFCRMPFDRPKPRPLPPTVRCPHCGAENLQLPNEPACRDCGRRYDEAPGAAKKAQAVAVRAARSISIDFRLVLYLVIVGTGLGLFAFQFRAQRRAGTADRVRHLKKSLEIFAIEEGGFPPSLTALERRYGPIPAHFKTDAWDRGITYRTLGAELFRNEAGLPLFSRCEVRSAGPNGEAGDEDDIAWTGTAP